MIRIGARIYACRRHKINTPLGAGAEQGREEDYLNDPAQGLEPRFNGYAIRHG